MTDKTWNIRIKGLVSRPHGAAHVQVPLGEYTMREVGLEDYRVSNNGQLEFSLTAREISTYISNDALVVSGRWP